MPSEPGERQVGQQEPHGEATRDSDQSGCGQGSQLRVSRMMLASRRDLPTFRSRWTQRRPRQLWTLE